MIMSRLVLRRMRNVSDKIVEKIKTHNLYPVTLFENHDLYEIMWKKKHDTARQATDGNMAHALCMLGKATETHWVYATLAALPQQQYLSESTSMLRLYVLSLSY